MTNIPAIWSEIDPRLRRIAEYFMARNHRDDVDPVELGAALLPMVYVLRLERPASDGAIRMRIGLVGTALDASFDRPLRGRYMDEFLHGPRAEDVMAAYQQCETTRRPFWMRHVGSFRNGHHRFVEGVGVYLEPDCIYGGLFMGDFTHRTPRTAEFRHALLA